MGVKFPWGWGNEVLYRMCRDEPHHSDCDVISGKLWLIGRAYAAAIERGAGEAIKDGEDFHETIAPQIKASDLDNWLDGIADITVIDKNILCRILEVHQRFNLLLKMLTKRERPSFASKYLHFHSPNAFFIFDSRADKGIREKFDGRHFDIPASCVEAEQKYASFVLRCIEYRDLIAAESNEPPMTPRQLDQRLLGYGALRDPVPVQ